MTDQEQEQEQEQDQSELDELLELIRERAIVEAITAQC